MNKTAGNSSTDAGHPQWPLPATSGKANGEPRLFGVEFEFPGVSIDELATLVASTLGGELSEVSRAEFSVNNLHHQAVREAGAELAVTGRDRDGIVEGIERNSGPARVGVQWHPEYMPQRADQRRLPRHFVRACDHRAPR